MIVYILIFILSLAILSVSYALYYIQNKINQRINIIREEIEEFKKEFEDLPLTSTVNKLNFYYGDIVGRLYALENYFNIESELIPTKEKHYEYKKKNKK